MGMRQKLEVFNDRFAVSWVRVRLSCSLEPLSCRHGWDSSQTQCCTWEKFPADPRCL